MKKLIVIALAIFVLFKLVDRLAPDGGAVVIQIPKLPPVQVIDPAPVAPAVQDVQPAQPVQPEISPVQPTIDAFYAQQSNGDQLSAPVDNHVRTPADIPQNGTTGSHNPGRTDSRTP